MEAIIFYLVAFVALETLVLVAMEWNFNGRWISAVHERNEIEKQKLGVMSDGLRLSHKRFEHLSKDKKISGAEKMINNVNMSEMAKRAEGLAQ